MVILYETLVHFYVLFIWLVTFTIFFNTSNTYCVLLKHFIWKLFHTYGKVARTAQLPHILYPASTSINILSYVPHFLLYILIIIFSQPFEIVADIFT